MIIVAEDNHRPFANKYRDSLVYDSTIDKYYLYDCEGTWAELCADCNGGTVVPTEKNEYQAFADQSAFPAVGDVDTLYYSAADNALYIWDTVAYVPITGGIVPSFSLAGDTGTGVLTPIDILSILTGNGLTSTLTGQTFTITLDGVTTATAGQVLTSDGAGNVSWVTPTTAPPTTIAVPADEDYTNADLIGSTLTVVGSLTNFYYTVYRNGLRQKRVIDYTVAGQVITFVDAPVIGEDFAVEFRGKNTL